MVEPISIGVVVAALIAKALDRAEDGAVDSAVKVALKAVERLRARFSGDAEAEAALDGLVNAPDSGRQQKALAGLLEARARESPDLLDELKAIVGEAEAAGVQIGPIEQVAEGDGNVQNAGIVGSQVNVGQGTTPRKRD
jgi:hypothetical protein